MTDLNRHIINLKKSTCLWLKETNSKTHQQAIINLLTSYNNFFKNKNHFGLPKFKSKHHKQSCRFPIDAISSSCFINTKFSLVTGLKDIVNKLIDENKIICLETLSVDSMLKTKNLAKSISEKLFGRSVLLLKSKGLERGCQVVQIDRFYPSSKICSSCLVKNVDLKLGDRNWICSNCGIEHDRDLNAALNIEKDGLKMVGMNKPNPVLGNISKV